MTSSYAFAICDTIQNQWVRPSERRRSISKFTSDVREAKLYKTIKMAQLHLKLYSEKYFGRKLAIKSIEMKVIW